MPLVWRTRCLRRVEMGRADDDLYSVGGKPLEHRNRHIHRRRAVVDTRQQMRVDVDHPRAIERDPPDGDELGTASAEMARIAAPARSSRLCGSALAASKAYVTSASAASRS